MKKGFDIMDESNMEDILSAWIRQMSDDETFLEMINENAVISDMIKYLFEGSQRLIKVKREYEGLKDHYRNIASGKPDD